MNSASTQTVAVLGSGTMGVEHCTFPNWAGTEPARFFRFEGDWLILETPTLPMGGREAVARLIWKRIQG